MKKMLRFGAFCAASAMPFAASAQEQLPPIVIEGQRVQQQPARANPQPAPAGPLSLTVPTAAEATREIQQTPGSVAIIPDSQLRLQRSVTIKDALDYVPGVFAQPKWGEDTRLSIRGSGLSRNFHLRGVQLYHGWNSDQHGRRLRRFSGNRPERVSFHRSL